MSEDDNEPISSQLPSSGSSSPPITGEATVPVAKGDSTLRGDVPLRGESTRALREGAVQGERTVDLPLSDDTP